MITIQKFNKGFTLIELLIAMVISAIVISGMYALLYKQVATHNTERLMVSMQQNARAAVSFMETDIRMARYDPTGSGLFTIATANRARLQFLSDNIVEDGALGAGETITYALVDDVGATCDADGNGIADSTPCNLGRQIDGGTFQIVARNIDALNFDYFDTSVNPVNPLIDTTLTPWQVPAGDIVDIGSIRVSIVARSGATIPALFVRHTDSTVYLNRSSNTILTAQNDVFRRMQITTEIDCRN